MSDNAEREQHLAEQAAFSERAAAMVAAQAPRLFATVVTKQDADTEIIGWGMEFDDSAYMITADGRNQYFLAEAENALMYVRSEPGATADLVWVAPAVLVSRDRSQT
ncbi:hypothetical protein JOF56_002511 [Kibdelosporangium banguiense]|uniref:Immunity protein 35 n=1 Tax=Kibdelosporangium banguiense TaxID=1365924 RepID=A0ABS4TCH1_9PSEU|nr:hypothetical protein [Kibdelosporangium banguiense]MBP2322126.1 hypothetical protein [Kibdelosporangium banguiense]